MHVAAASFWECYAALPSAIQKKSDKAYALLKVDPHHPSLHFKQVGRFWSARVDRGFRAVAVKAPDAWVWFWIGPHAEYERLIK